MNSSRIVPAARQKISENEKRKITFNLMSITQTKINKADGETYNQERKRILND